MSQQPSGRVFSEAERILWGIASPLYDRPCRALIRKGSGLYTQVDFLKRWIPLLRSSFVSAPGAGENYEHEDQSSTYDSDQRTDSQCRVGSEGYPRSRREDV